MYWRSTKCGICLQGNEICLCYVKVNISSHANKIDFSDYFTDALNNQFQFAVQTDNFLFGWLYDQVISWKNKFKNSVTFFLNEKGEPWLNGHKVTFFIFFLKFWKFVVINELNIANQFHVNVSDFFDLLLKIGSLFLKLVSAIFYQNFFFIKS